MTDMFAPGASLRAAREKLKLTQADIAESTRIKVHLIDAIENNDFSRLNTPLYAKGFIKMYAERVGLEPEPLIRDYLVRHAQMVRPTLSAEQAPVPARRAVAKGAGPAISPGHVRTAVSMSGMLLAGHKAALRMAGGLVGATQQALGTVKTAWAGRIQTGTRRGADAFVIARDYGKSSDFPVGRYAAIGTAVIVLAILIGVGVSLFKGSAQPPQPEPVVVTAPVAAKPAQAVAPRLKLAQEPPAPYLKPRKP